MPDRLIIHAIAASCRVGVSDEEREQPQTVWIDIELPIDAAKAAHRDDVLDAVDYAQLVSAVTQQVQSASYRLLETVAEEVASLALKESRAKTVLVRIKKRALPGIEHAAVEIERQAR